MALHSIANETMTFDPALLDSVEVERLDFYSPVKQKISDDYSLIIKIENDHLSASYFYNLAWAPNLGQRPPGFTGAAVKITVDRNDALWFEPERDGSKVYNDSETIRAVRRAVEDGYACASVSLIGPAIDEYGGKHHVEIACESVGGLDWDEEYITETIRELISTIACQFNNQEMAA